MRGLWEKGRDKGGPDLLELGYRLASLGHGRNTKEIPSVSCAHAKPGALGENAREHLRRPKKTALQQPKTCVGNAYWPQVRPLRGGRLGQV